MVDQLGQGTHKAAIKHKDDYARALCCIRELSWLYYWRGNLDGAVKWAKEGLKLALTVINLNSQRKKFDGPDNGLVTELMQARLNAGGLKQEQWASSVALAYEYAVLGN